MGQAWPMIYTRARYLRDRPTAPFYLGGQYHGASDLHYLGDAQGSLLLKGSPNVFPQLDEKDLVRVRVVEIGEAELVIDEVRVIVRAKPGRSARAPKPCAEKFPRFISDVRRLLLARGLSECLTPTLVVCPGLEPSLEPFATELTLGGKKKTVYLPTSPEIHLKKAVARGWHDVFEIKSVFRRGEFSPHHEAEFLMLEWYRGFADLEMVVEDLLQLLAGLAGAGWMKPVEVRVTDFATLFAEIYAFDLTAQTRADELRDLLNRNGLGFGRGETFNDLFHRLVIERIEPSLATRGPTIVRRFPPSLAALAKIDAAGWADRFEFYWNGLEIANAFNEVTDAEEQARRWATEANERARLGTTSLPEDPELIESLRQGFPPTGGIALGVERLFMAARGVKDIRDLRMFSAPDLGR